MARPLRQRPTAQGGGPSPGRRQRGFALTELLLAFGLGLGLTGLMLQTVVAEGHNGQRLARVLRERLVAQRALELMRSDLQRANTVAADAGAAGAAAACNLGGRTVVLHLESPDGSITYSVGRPAESIWRGRVLMRCGTAFGLDGTPSSGKALNRVVLDGLASTGGASASLQGPGVLRVQLRQQLPLRGQSVQLLEHRRLLPLPTSF